MKRMEAITAVARVAGDSLLVCNLGFPSRELFSASDRPENFYMMGSMGLCSSIGLGLALARPDRKIISLEGDGAVLMNLGTLATIACTAPANYLLVILDNGSYCSTGCQPTATSLKTDLAEMARGAGVQRVIRVSDTENLIEALGGSGVVLAQVEAGNAEVPVIGLSPKDVTSRFRSAIRLILDSDGDGTAKAIRKISDE
jgi:sulfopyruvate decarboxylase subunit beta